MKHRSKRRHRTEDAYPTDRERRDRRERIFVMLVVAATAIVVYHCTGRPLDIPQGIVVHQPMSE